MKSSIEAIIQYQMQNSVQSTYLHIAVDRYIHYITIIYYDCNFNYNLISSLHTTKVRN